MNFKKLKSGALRLRPFDSAQGLRSGQAGFTLVEMLVTISIFIIIFTLVSVNFRRGERLESFRLATQQLASNLRQAQTLALTGIGGEESMSQAYGVYFNLDNPDQYITFSDDNGNYLYNQGEDEIIETIILPEEITLSVLPNDGPLTIVFEPPKSTVYIHDGQDFVQTAEIRLSREYYDTKVGVINLNGITGQVSAELENVGE